MKSRVLGALSLVVATVLVTATIPSAFATNTIPLLGFAWDHPTITYSINTGKRVDPAAVTAATDAINAWNTAIDSGANGDFTLVPASPGTKADIRISLKVGTGVVLGSAQTFINPDGSAKYSKVTLSGKAFGDPLGHDAVQTIAIQELGHSLGLGHSDDPNDPMYGTFNGIKLSPSTCDVVAFDAVEEWYPTGTFHTPTASSVTCD